MDIKTHCGIYGFSLKNIKKDLCNNVKKGLNKLQHRGQEGVGICYSVDNEIKIIHQEGLVEKLKVDGISENILNSMGHVRYSTSKSNQGNKNEIQPLIGNSKDNKISLCHNGNIPKWNRPNSNENENDTMYILRYIINKLNNGHDIIDILRSFINEIESSYCLSILYKQKIYLVRDKHGVRPFILGENDLGLVFSSESCAFQKDTKIIRDIEPGEILCLNKGNIDLSELTEKKPSVCIFEYVYFLKEESIVNGVSVKQTRENMGVLLAIQDNNKQVKPPEDSIVVGSPNSGITCGIFYAKIHNFEYQQIIQKNINKRTFIENNQKNRKEALKRKFRIEGNLENKSIVFVDDSMVRGNTVKQIITMLRKENVREIHIRIASPQVKNECFFGIDIPDKINLIAKKNNLEQIKELLGCDSLEYLNIVDTIESVKNTNIKYKKFCTGCFNKDYGNLLDW